MEGVQVGGVRSYFGVLGSWTTIFHEQHDPVGKSLLVLREYCRLGANRCAATMTVQDRCGFTKRYRIRQSIYREIDGQVLFRQ